MSTAQRKVKSRAAGLPAMRPQVAGIDIGSRQMHVCAPSAGDEQAEPVQVRVFATTTAAIEDCGRWLKELGVESIAMESTGVYWIPVLEILESAGFEVLLVDTRPLSRVPGRKTDMSDCQWIQNLHRCGLLKGSFRPQEAIVQLRSLVRQKAVLVAEQADWVRRLQKCLDQMNVRVHHAVADTQGMTGMAIVRAIVAGERNPRRLAELRDARCHKSEEQIAALLQGHWRADHLFNLEQGLKLYDALGERITAYEQEIEKRMQELTPPAAASQTAPPLPNAARMKALKRRQQLQRRQTLFRLAAADLTSIDGIGVETAEVLISEYGVDLRCFPDEHHFIAHLQLAPRQAISGGKPLHKRRGRSARTRAGHALRMAATALRNSRTALGAYYRRLARTKSASIAVFATARKLAALVFRLLRWGQAYVDEGQQAYEQRYRAARLRSLAETAAQFGYQIIPKTEPANA